MTGELTGSLDPTGHYSELPKERLVNAIGILPNWTVIALYENGESIKDFTTRMADLYGFGDLFEFTGHGEITEEGIYNYPEDPPQYPLAVMRNQELTVWFWPNAMLGIVDQDGEVFVTRMD